MNALILCNGEPPSLELLAQHLPQSDLVICTDGALHWVEAMGCRPQVLIGDMDSAATAAECEVVDCGPHEAQEDTDAEKALRLALERGAERIVLLGATGIRLDHTLGNVWLAARYHDRAEVVLADDWGELRVTSGRLVLPTELGRVISLMALTPDVSLDTEGLRWPLHGAFDMGTRGLSNEATGVEVVVDVRAGLVAVIVPKVR